jgi:DUF4097 and DUF4098 domain-containing protein YvlB
LLPRDAARPNDVKAAEQTRIDFNNGTLAVTSGRGFAFPRRGAIVVDIELPTGSRLHVAVASALLTANGEYADCKLASASGSLTVGHLRGNLNAQTSSGDITVASAVNGHVCLLTASGEVSVGIPEGTAAQLDLRTGSGSVRNTVAPSDGPADGDETLVVHSRTASGGVIVHRATGPAAA